MPAATINSAASAAGPTIIVNPLTRIATPAVTSGVLVAAGNYAAVSVDGCAVRLSGDDSEGRRQSSRVWQPHVRAARLRSRFAEHALRRRWRMS
jgi:hypothetical protein